MFALLKKMISQSFPPKPTFSVDQIPDLTGQVIVVTGGNTGIGYETAKAVLAKNAKVYVACRSSEKGKSAIARLREETGRDAHFLRLDLSSFASIEQAAQEFLGSEKRLHILFNNAGVMEPPLDLTTTEGYDLTVGTNVVGTYYFTTLVLPALLAVAQDGSQKARIVNTSSSASEAAPNMKKIDYSIFKGPDDKERRKLGTRGVYYASKWMNIVFMTEFSRRYGDKGIASTAVNPGNIRSELQRHWGGLQTWIVDRLLLYPTPYGALTQLYAGTSEHADEFDGQYFVPWARRAEPNPTSQDPAEGKRLWEWLEAQVKKHE
ncbi:short-chain alcohol dehydrogenase [Marasmius tenuissimus]|uniref:Short-chain alcohol dehydrogenase n=1 Tax=Marasmius tenuissimus TaxID=585030 RepID=A0ABR3A0B1_9AGAR|nr:short-chain alcohol dehydrogenase [Marasmius tenuissimus]